MNPTIGRKTYENVWHALEPTTGAAALMTMRSDLLIALQEHIGTWKTTQAEAARRLATSQPRLNDLMRGRINKFSLDMLVELAERAGLDVSLRIKKAA